MWYIQPYLKEIKKIQENKDTKLKITGRGGGQVEGDTVIWYS